MNSTGYRITLFGAALFVVLAGTHAAESRAGQWQVLNCTNGTIKATVCSSGQENISKGRSHQWQIDKSRCDIIARDAGSSRMQKVTSRPPGTYAVKEASSSKFSITAGNC